MSKGSATVPGKQKYLQVRIPWDLFLLLKKRMKRDNKKAPAVTIEALRNHLKP